jgi:hypothetical protein
MSYRQVFLCNEISAVKRTEFVTDRMSCTVLRGRFCDIIILNVRAVSDAN